MIKTGLDSPIKILVFLLCLLTIGLTFWTRYLDEFPPVAYTAPMPQASSLPPILSAFDDIDFEQEIGQLAPPMAGYRRQYDQATAIGDLIRSHRFADAAAAFQPYLKDSSQRGWNYTPILDLSEAALSYLNSDFLQHIGVWLEQQPTSAVPYLLRSLYYQKLADRYRSTGFISQVSEQNVNQFDHYTELARQDIRQARKLADNPLLQFVEMSIVGYHDGDSQDLEQLFSESHQKFPGNFRMHALRLNYLSPKWGGSIEQLYRFVDDYAAPAASDSPLRFLYVALYNILLDHIKISCNDDSVKDPVRCKERYQQQVIRPDLLERAQDAAMIDHYADRHGYALSFNKHLGAGNDLFPRIAKKLGHNLDINAADTSQNLYFLDKIQAIKFYYGEDYPSAEKLLRRALLELERFPFPDRQDHDLEQAKIYDALSDVFFYQHDYAKSIIYQQAANRLAGPVRETAGINDCNSYMNLKKYAEAIKTCGEEYQTNANLTALLWRGIAYQRSRAFDLAIADLRTVAEQPNDYRASAAIQLSTVYDDMGQYQNAVDTLDRYPFAFDAKTEQNSTVALAYNDRCYALMNLNKLEEALKDCNTSLQYDQIPDAIHKIRDINKRLNRP